VFKKTIIAILILAIISVCTGIYLWYKPHQKVEDAKGIGVTAEALSKEYAANEPEANVKYLNKAIEVSGTVNEVVKNQDGGLMVILDTGDPTSGIQCAMREKDVQISQGQKLVIKGFCSGKLMDVSLTDCVIKK
jgi:hypothetical protein